MPGDNMKKNLISSLLAVILTGIAGAAAAQVIDPEELVPFEVPAVQAPQELQAGNGFLIIGHAGAVRLEPENTLEGFRQALNYGANALETDLSITRDGQLINWHDWDPDDAAALAKQAGLQGFKYKPRPPVIGSGYRRRVDTLNLEDIIREYGYCLNQPGCVRSKHKIPTFEQFAKWAAGESRLKLIYLDIKIPEDREELVPVFVDAVAKVAGKYAINDRMVLFSPYINILTKMAIYSGQKGYNLEIGLDRELPVKLFMEETLTNIQEQLYSVVGLAAKFGLKYSSIGKPTAITLLNGWRNYQQVVRTNVKAKKHYPAIQFISWTIDDESEMRWLINAGVDGIVTDNPARLAYIFNSME